MKKITDYTSVRIQISTRTRLDKLVEALVRSGWNSIGADRADAPGVASVIDQGLAMVEAKLKVKR